MNANSNSLAHIPQNASVAAKHIPCPRDRKPHTARCDQLGRHANPSRCLMIEAGTPSAGSTISPAAYGNAKMFRERPRRGKQTFGILPPYDLDAKRASLRDVRLPRRVSRLLASIIVSLTFLGLYSLLEFESGGWVPTNLPWQQRLPPLYPEYRLRELALPQHNLDLPYPEGRNGKYLWISEHVRGMFHDACIPFPSSLVF